MGANIRSTVGTATDANAMLRILFSRVGQPNIGSPQAFSFNVASISGAGAVTMERAGRTVKERRDFNIVGGMCLRCEGRGAVNDIDLTALYDDSKSINEGALTIPGFSIDGWYGRIFNGCGFFDPDKPIRKFTKKESDALLHKEATKIKVDGVNLTYLGLIPQIKKSFLSKDVDAMQPHIRAFVERAVTFSRCPDCAGTRLNEAARSSKIKGLNIADAIITLEGPEIPILDGSALPFVNAIRTAVPSPPRDARPPLILDRPIEVVDPRGSRIRALPRSAPGTLYELTAVERQKILDYATLMVMPSRALPVGLIQGRRPGLVITLPDPFSTTVACRRSASSDGQRSSAKSPSGATLGTGPDHTSRASPLVCKRVIVRVRLL